MSTSSASIRKKVYRLLEPGTHSSAGLSFVNKLIVGLICLAVVLAIVDSEPAIPDMFRQTLPWIDLTVTLLFAAEYLTRLWVAGEDQRYRGAVGRLRYILTPMAVIDLLAILPPLLGLVGGEAFVLRLARLLRILRVARLGRFSEATAAIAEALSARRYELGMSVVISGVLLLITSTLLYIVEGDAQPGIFGSIPRAMWWSIATLTTVGYGDAVPVTALGRILAGATAMLGIGLIALPTGILAAAFSDVIQRHRTVEALEQKTTQSELDS